jgi:hypothetical protein
LLLLPYKNFVGGNKTYGGLAAAQRAAVADFEGKVGGGVSKMLKMRQLMANILLV